MRVYLFLMIIAAGLVSCKKNWLDEKPIQSQVIPETLADIQLLLDNTNVFNSESPSLGELGSDDYYLQTSYFLGRPIKDRNVYVWANGDVYAGSRIFDWEGPYQQIYYANSVLERLERMSSTSVNEQLWKHLRGSALFFRANAYYHLAQIFCKTYEKATSLNDAGLILRTEANFNAPSARSSVEATYQLIIRDLIEAKDMLMNTQIYKTRPTTVAAFGLLARVSIIMGQYDAALSYASKCLQLKSDLMDYNTVPLPASGHNPFDAATNKEIIFLERQATTALLTQETRRGFVDSTLYQSYQSNDLRKKLFFKTISGRLSFVGSYYGGIYLFSGLSTNEIYLIKAEANARLGNISEAMQDLNTLLLKRWNNTTPYVPYSATNAKTALTIIFNERRKELCFRGIRWTDLRRLNKEPDFSKTLTRNINGQIFTLSPNDLKYVWPIPNNEIQFSRIAQNPR